MKMELLVAMLEVFMYVFSYAAFVALILETMK